MRSRCLYVRIRGIYLYVRRTKKNEIKHTDTNQPSYELHFVLGAYRRKSVYNKRYRCQPHKTIFVWSICCFHGNFDINNQKLETFLRHKSGTTFLLHYMPIKSASNYLQTANRIKINWKLCYFEQKMLFLRPRNLQYIQYRFQCDNCF